MVLESVRGLNRRLWTWTRPLPAAADVVAQDDLCAPAAHGAVRLVAVFIVAIQRLREVLLKTGARVSPSRRRVRGGAASGGG